MTTSADREARLPAWARQELTRLRRDLDTARARLADGPGDSDTFAGGYGHPQTPLGRGTMVTFHTARGRMTAQYDAERDVVEVLFSARVDDDLAVRPRASNVVWLGAMSRRQS